MVVESEVVVVALVLAIGFVVVVVIFVHMGGSIVAVLTAQVIVMLKIL